MFSTEDEREQFEIANDSDHFIDFTLETTYLGSILDNFYKFISKIYVGNQAEEIILLKKFVSLLKEIRKVNVE